MKHYKKYILLSALIITSLICGIFIYNYGYTYAKYTSDSVWDYFLKSMGFYFDSDYLGVDTAYNTNNLWNGESVHFNLKNNLNDELITEYDINYDISCQIEGDAASHTECHLNGTTSNEQSGVLSYYQVCINNTEDEVDVSSFNKTNCELGGYDWTTQSAIKDLYFDIVVTDENYELLDLTVNITATSTSPYHKTLNGTFNLHKIYEGKGKVSMHYDNYSNYDRLVISNSYSIDKTIKVSWDSSKLLINSDNSVFSSYETDENDYINEIVFDINARSSVSYIFYSRTGAAYTIDEFSIDEFPFGEEEEENVAQVTDTTPGTLSGAGTSVSPYLVESIEDLVALSNSVNSGTTYNGKFLKITQSLDFSNVKSYVNPQTIAYGDINGNSSTEALITELTTQKGFAPIGSYSTSSITFKGTLDGNNTTIYHLYIKRPTTNYVGLFGYLSNATIKNLNTEDSYVEGNSYVGTLIGYSYSGFIQNISGKKIKVTSAGNYVGGALGYLYYNDKVSNINLSEIDITGYNYVGGAFGYMDSMSSVAVEIVADGTVTGNDRVGGLSGYVYAGSVLKGVNNGVNVTSIGTNVGRLAGATYAGYIISGLTKSTATVNGVTVTGSSTDKNGANINSMSDINDINLAEAVYDSYIGGDNDGDGYYYDYDETGKIVKKNTTDSPLTFTLSGAGTVASPYIINNYEELRQASLKMDKVFKLNADIDLSGKRFYMMGSYTTNFSGTFNGGYYTISNLKIKRSESDYIGFTGYSNKGTIKNLKLNNVEIEGKNYVGVMTGYNYYAYVQNIEGANVKVTSTGNYVGGIAGYGFYTGAITNINFSGLNITGNNNVGGVIGYSDRGPITNLIVQGTIAGNNNVGGLAGYTYYGTTLKGINKGLNVTAVSNSGRLTGSTYGAGYTILGSSLSTVTINASTVAGGTSSNKNGQDISESNLSETATYTSLGFNFADEAQECIWYLDGNVAKFRKGSSY